MEIKKEILKSCIKKGFLIDKEVLEALSSFELSFSEKLINGIFDAKVSEKFLTKDFFESNYYILEVLFCLNDECILLDNFISKLNINKKEQKLINYPNDVKILSSNSISSKKIEISDFIQHFRNRYEQIREILQENDLKNLKSIRRLSSDRETQTIIVMVMNKKTTKNKNLLLEVEDLTGRTKILVNENRGELYDKCKNILLDEVLAFEVSGSKELMFANKVIFPDMHLLEKKKGENDCNMAVISDLHIGSKMFLESNFLDFIKWLNGEKETDKELSKKIKYLFIVGDTIDGVGVFPDQEKLLEIKEILAQYKKLAECLNLIRKDVKIILCPGQHDAVWVGEPQLVIGEKWASDLYKMNNLTLVTNPALVEVEGFKIIMYHGASFHGVVEQNSDIRVNNGSNNPTIILKELLKGRHLAPTHGECDYVPNEKKDSMVLDTIPDIILTGDLHRPEVSNYNNILLIASSCWQSITPFEEKIGNNPDPCKVPVFNFKTREIKTMDFLIKVEAENGGN